MLTTIKVKLLDIFIEDSKAEAGEDRVIPYLPGKVFATRKSKLELAQHRLPLIKVYLEELLQTPHHISRSKHVIDFFRPSPEEQHAERYVLSTPHPVLSQHSSHRHFYALGDHPTGIKKNRKK